MTARYCVFTALLHHITVDLLKRSYLALERNTAPGIDGVTWQAYEESLEVLEAISSSVFSYGFRR